MMAPPCRVSCPVDKDIPGFLRAIATGDTAGAWRIAFRDNLFPGVLGHICSRPCESSCRLVTRGGDPVPICLLKRWVSELEGADRRPLARPHPEGPRVAVVGAGPAGLAAAHDLVVLGARVTLFDRRDVPGGLLAGCIPSFRLPAHVVEEDVARILDMGVDFRPGIRFTSMEDIAALRSQYAAIILALGAGEPIVPGIPGWRTSACTTTAVEFLRARESGEGTLSAAASLEGARVAVIGGGNAALDAARAARHAGAGEVRILYRRTRDEMPAHPREIADAEGEGIVIQELTLPVGVEWESAPVPGRCGAGAPTPWGAGVAAASSPRLRGLVTVRTQSDAAARRAGRPVRALEGSERFEFADLVIAAIGQRHPRLGGGAPAGTPGLPPGVIPCGDYATGPGTVTEAIASGRRAAATVRAALAKAGRWNVPDDHFERLLWESVRLTVGVRVPDSRRGPRFSPAGEEASRGRRVLATASGSLPLLRDSAVSAAAACMGCDRSLAFHPERCLLCGACALRCSENCLRWTEDRDAGVFRLQVDDVRCIRCGDCMAACPSGAIEWTQWTRRNRNLEAPVSLFR